MDVMDVRQVQGCAVLWSENGTSVAKRRTLSEKCRMTGVRSERRVG